MIIYYQLLSQAEFFLRRVFLLCIISDWTEFELFCIHSRKRSCNPDRAASCGLRFVSEAQKFKQSKDNKIPSAVFVLVNMI